MRKLPLPLHLKWIAFTRLKDLDIDCQCHSDGVYVDNHDPCIECQINCLIIRLLSSTAQLRSFLESCWSS